MIVLYIVQLLESIIKV